MLRQRTLPRAWDKELFVALYNASAVARIVIHQTTYDDCVTGKEATCKQRSATPKTSLTLSKKTFRITSKYTKKR